MKNMKSSDLAKLIGSIAICQGAGGIGSFFTAPKIQTWYTALEKPAFTPPNSVFMPVWITLYTLIGIAVFLIWRKGLHKQPVKTAFILFWIQLALSALWSVIFFGLESPFFGFMVIISLWVLVLITTIKFFRLSHIAGGLLIPYISWISVASVLNAWIWILNP